LLGLAAPAMAQQQGSLVLDAMTTPGRHFGLGYYITDRISLRPSLGASYSGEYGMTYDLGADVRYELLPGHRVSPYATASLIYLHSQSLVQYDASGFALGASDPNVVRYGAGVGFRTRLKYGLALVGEGRLMNSALRDDVGGAFSGQQAYQNGAHFEAAVGISYAFN
jgi:hypothetical protein